MARAAADQFCAARAAEGASPRTVEWYRMITVRCVRRFGEAWPVDSVAAAVLRAWLLELRATLSPESAAGYVRGPRAFGNWCATEEVAGAAGFRAIRRPKVPRRSGVPIGQGWIGQRKSRSAARLVLATRCNGGYGWRNHTRTTLTDLCSLSADLPDGCDRSS